MTLKLTGVGIFQFSTCTRLAAEPTHPPDPWVLGALRLGNKGMVPEMLWHFTFALCTSFHSAMLKTRTNSAVWNFCPQWFNTAINCSMENVP